jgi:hypothetical protein
MKHFPFSVVNQDGKPYIKVEYRGEEKRFVSAIQHELICANADFLTLPLLVSRRNLVHGLVEDEGDRRVVPWSILQQFRRYCPRILQ